MKKILLTLLFMVFSYPISFAQNGDILSVKYMFSPVISSVDQSAHVITMLQKWYVVLDLWTNWDYTHVMLTDGKKWFILSSYLENYTFNNYKIDGNKWSIKSNTILYSQPISSSKQLWTLKSGNEFYILHVNYINSNFLKVKVINGAYKNKTWYIENNNINISHISDFKSEIQKFIEKYAKNQNWVVYLNNWEKEYQPMFEWDDISNTVSIFQKQTKNSSHTTTFWNTQSWQINNQIIWSGTNINSQNNELNDFLNLLNLDNYLSGSTSNNNQSNLSNNKNTSNSNNDISDFLNLLDLNKYLSGSTTNQWSSTSQNWGWTTSTKNNNISNSWSSNNDINDFLDLLDLNKYLSGTTNNTQQNNDVNDFLNLLNLENYYNNTNSSQSEDVNAFLDSLNKTLNTSSWTTTNQGSSQEIDINNFLQLLNSGL